MTTNIWLAWKNVRVLWPVISLEDKDIQVANKTKEELCTQLSAEMWQSSSETCCYCACVFASIPQLISLGSPNVGWRGSVCSRFPTCPTYNRSFPLLWQLYSDFRNRGFHVDCSCVQCTETSGLNPSRDWTRERYTTGRCDRSSHAHRFL